MEEINKKVVAKVENTIIKIRIQIEKNIVKKNYDKALRLLSSCAKIQYVYNQNYVDEIIEKQLNDIRLDLKLETSDSKKDKDTVIFYDGFGYDTRGLGRIYIKALISCGYKVIYITDIEMREKCPLIEMELQKGSYEQFFIDSIPTERNIMDLNNIFMSSNAAYAFLYTYPEDVNAVIVFRQWEEKIKRFQINLTDHAFWLGKYSFDYCIEFRDYGACISKYKRKIGEKKLVYLPFYPIVDESLTFGGYPFEKGNKKVIFSGGALYKTLGAGNIYYEMVESILRQNPQVIFWYAGEGDTSELQKIVKKYPDRCFHTMERRDFLAVLKHCDLYLGTYPISGGLMTQFSALAGTPPLQLWYDEDCSGMLIKQETLGILYKNKEDLLERINELINQGVNPEYKEQLKGSVIKESEFAQNLNEIIRQGRTNYELNLDKDIDTTTMAVTYKERIKFEDIENCIVIRKNLKIWYMYPNLFIRVIIKRIIRKLLR